MGGSFYWFDFQDGVIIFDTEKVVIFNFELENNNFHVVNFNFWQFYVRNKSILYWYFLFFRSMICLCFICMKKSLYKYW